MSLKARLTLASERWRWGSSALAEHMLQLSITQHQEIMEQQCKQQEGILELFNCQAEQDRLFEQSTLSAVSSAAQEDRRAMAEAFQENRQLMRESFTAIRDFGTQGGKKKQVYI